MKHTFLKDRSIPQNNPLPNTCTVLRAFPRVINSEQMKELDSVETLIAEQYILDGYWVLKGHESAAGKYGGRTGE